MARFVRSCSCSWIHFTDKTNESNEKFNLHRISYLFRWAGPEQRNTIAN